MKKPAQSDVGWFFQIGRRRSPKHTVLSRRNREQSAITRQTAPPAWNRVPTQDAPGNRPLTESEWSGTCPERRPPGSPRKRERNKRMQQTSDTTPWPPRPSSDRGFRSDSAD